MENFPMLRYICFETFGNTSSEAKGKSPAKPNKLRSSRSHASNRLSPSYTHTNTVGAQFVVPLDAHSGDAELAWHSLGAPCTETFTFSCNYSGMEMELFLSPAQVYGGVYGESIGNSWAHIVHAWLLVWNSHCCVFVCVWENVFCLLLSYFIFVISLLIRGGGNWNFSIKITFSCHSS